MIQNIYKHEEVRGCIYGEEWDHTQQNNFTIGVARFLYQGFGVNYENLQTI